MHKRNSTESFSSSRSNYFQNKAMRWLQSKILWDKAKRERMKDVCKDNRFQRIIKDKSLLVRILAILKKKTLSLNHARENKCWIPKNRMGNNIQNYQGHHKLRPSKTAKDNRQWFGVVAAVATGQAFQLYQEKL